MGYQEINSATIDKWIEEGWEWGKPITHDVFLQAKKGKWDIVLTPTKKVPHEWFGEIKGKSIFGLAAGGGQQMPIFAALGAKCTVLDYSNKQIESDLMVAKREGYEINAIRGDMTKPFPFKDESFDIIINPVSLCYIEKVEPIFKECFRVLKKGGILICGIDNSMNHMVSENNEKEIVFKFPFNPLKNKDQMKECLANDDGVQFSHTLEETIGGQLKAGFTLTDIYEDTNGYGYLHDMNIPSFFATRAIKK